MRRISVVVVILGILTMPVWAVQTMTSLQARQQISKYSGCSVEELVPANAKDGYREPTDFGSGSYEFTLADRSYVLFDNPRQTFIVRVNKNTDGSFKSINETEIWTSFPDMNRSDMVVQYESPTYTCYYKKLSEGSLDYGVMLTINRNERGDIWMYGYNNKPFPMNPIATSITRDQAIDIAVQYANNYQYLEEKLVWPFGYSVYKDISGPYQMLDEYGNGAPVYKVSVDITDNADTYERLKAGSKEEYPPSLEVWVDAANKVVVWDVFTCYLSGKRNMNVPMSLYKPSRVAVHQNGQNITVFTVPVKQGTTCLLPLTTIQALAKGHTVTAKADAKAFKLDGKELALPAKVLNRKGVLYLPWQALNSLPGVKAQYDAKLAKLDITTASATAAK